MRKLHDYKCPKCGNVEEHFVRLNETIFCSCEDPPVEMKRMPSAPGMVKTNFADKTGFKKR